MVQEGSFGALYLRSRQRNAPRVKSCVLSVAHLRERYNGGWEGMCPPWVSHRCVTCLSMIRASCTTMLWWCSTKRWDGAR